MLLANLDKNILHLRRQCYSRRFRYQSLTLAHDLSLLRFLRRFIVSRLHFRSDNPLLYSNASQNKQSRFCILFSDPLTCLHVSQ